MASLANGAGVKNLCPQLAQDAIAGTLPTDLTTMKLRSAMAGTLWHDFVGVPMARSGYGTRTPILAITCGAMRSHARSAFLLVLLVSLSAFARDRAWRTATFLGFNAAQTGTATMPVGTGSVTVPISTRNYWFRTDELDYCLYFPKRLSGRLPNLTINGMAKIAVDGRHVYVRDDDGKEWNFSIITKVAR
jgi:hypothetical protein